MKKEDFYFLAEDLKALDARINELRDKMEQTLKEGGESTRQSSETWHDNFPFEEAQRQFKMLSAQLRDLMEIKRKTRIAEAPKEKNEVTLGVSATIRDLTNGELKTFKIGSYMVFNDNSHPKTISYDSPLARIIFGAKVGEKRSGKIGKNEKKFVIVKIK